MRGNTGVAMLASVLQEMAQRTAGALDQNWITLGTIRDDGSLVLDDFTQPFALGDYLVLDTLDQEVRAVTRVNEVLLTDTTTLTTQPGGGDGHTHGITAHAHPTIPALLPELDERGRAVGAQDRVLCAWVNSGLSGRAITTTAKAVDVVVLGRVYWST